MTEKTNNGITERANSYLYTSKVKVWQPRRKNWLPR